MLAPPVEAASESRKKAKTHENPTDFSRPGRFASQSGGACKAAIDLAERLDAELQVYFVEDINLLRLAQLPFARELRYPCLGLSKKVDTLHMEEQLRGQAAQAQRLFQQLAEDRKIKHSFIRLSVGLLLPPCSRPPWKATCWCWGAPATRSFAPAD
ncbi:MAG: hypothetical protein IPK53_03460 [bacterium]|nr:hypothetical protein [bacterium]